MLRSGSPPKKNQKFFISPQKFLHVNRSTSRRFGLTGGSMKKSFEDNELAVKVGRQLARKRADAGLTQEYVAERLSVTLESVSRMERGLTLPNIAKLLKLAEIFGCAADDLLLSSSQRSIDQERVLVNKFKKLSDNDRELLIKFADMLNEHTGNTAAR